MSYREASGRFLLLLAPFPHVLVIQRQDGEGFAGSARDLPGSAENSAHRGAQPFPDAHRQTWRENEEMKKEKK